METNTRLSVIGSGKCCPCKALGMTTIWIKQEFGKYWNIFGEDEKADYEVDSQTTTLLMDNDDLKVDEA